jgi:hypothetical protein
MPPYQHDDCLAQFQAGWRYVEDTLAVEFERGAAGPPARAAA